MIAMRHTPVVATDRRSVLGDRARSSPERTGLVGLPRVEIPYPVAGTGADNLRRVARRRRPEVMHVRALHRA